MPRFATAFLYILEAADNVYGLWRTVGFSKSILSGRELVLEFANKAAFDDTCKNFIKAIE